VKEAEQIDNEWPGRSQMMPVLPALPRELLEHRGLVPCPLVFDGRTEPETVLILVQDPDVCDAFKGQELTGFFLRPGAAPTSWGTIFFLHFQIPDPAAGGREQLTFEYLVNTLDSEQFGLIRRLSRQTYWHLFLVDPAGTERNCFQFKNEFLLGEAIARTEKILRREPLRDFLKAKEEFFREYSMEDILSSEHG
jgi:hypothetical protein